MDGVCPHCNKAEGPTHKKCEQIKFESNELKIVQLLGEQVKAQQDTAQALQVISLLLSTYIVDGLPPEAVRSLNEALARL